MASIFEEQIKKRRTQTEAELRQAIGDASSKLGLKNKAVQGPRSEYEPLIKLLEALGYNNIEIPHDDFLTPFQVFENLLEKEGIMMRKVKLGPFWWKRSAEPYLGYDKEGNFVTLTPNFWHNGYIYKDIKGKRVRVNSKTFKERLSEDAYTFTVPLPNKKLGLKDLWEYIKRALPKSEVTLTIIISIIVILLGMITPAANKLLFNKVIPTGLEENIFPVASLLIGAVLGGVLMSLARTLVVMRTNKIVGNRLQNAVMARTFSLNPSFFMKYSSGDLVNRVNAAGVICGFISEEYLGIVLSGAFSLVYILQVFLYAKALLPLAVALIALNALLSYSYYKAIVKIQTSYQKEKSALSGLEFNLFSGVQKIKLTGSETRAYTHWLKNYSNSAKYIYNQPVWLSVLKALNSLLQIGGMALIYALAAKKGVTMSNFIAFSSAFGMVAGALLGIQGIIPSLASIKPTAELLLPILENVPESEASSKRVTSLSGAIAVNDLYFRYDKDGPMVINGISLKLEPGEYVGVVGESGCGKSTLLRLLLGFETPDSGSISYDSYDLFKVDKPSFRRHIGCCLQSGNLFAGDIFQNITITAPWSTREDAWEALRIANLEKDVRALPMGLNTLISGDGGGFSGGQKQRMLIARAVIGKPSIVFFDEATSALDNISQKQVSDNMDALNCTRLVIAHRLSTIKNCDRILVMDKGKIVEQGNFEQLMERKGLFYEMSKRQM